MTFSALGDDTRLLIRRYFIAKYQKEWWEKQGYEKMSLSQLLDAVREQHEDDYGILAKLIVTKLVHGNGDEAYSERSANIATAEREFNVTPPVELDEPMEFFGNTFANFVSHPKVTEAVNATVMWANQTGPPMLLLAGPPGVGKTHLALSAAKHIVDAGGNCIFKRESTLIDSIRTAMKDGLNAEGFIDSYSTTPRLIIDDLGAAALTETMRSVLDQIIDARWQHAGGIYTMVTTNLTGSQLPPRIASRLNDATKSKVVRIAAEDYRKRER